MTAVEQTKPEVDVDGLTLDDSYVRAVPELNLEWSASEAPEPELVAFNEGLATELGLDPDVLRSDAGVAVLAGNALQAGSKPVAMAYAGHQFGNYSPRLGDGRALLLGEIVGSDGSRVDLHLKGSGRTPFARGGDGKASIGPMLREFVIAEAMHALDIPTTRSLAVLTTGEPVMRQFGPEPGALLARTAASHIRVGTFEYTARLGDLDVLQRLVDQSIQRHHPAAATSERPALALLEAVAAAQALLIARWMAVGFIHGVMNTDNMTISGEGIDYGPCAFMDRYDPATVFSSIDHAGRYAYGNQPSIAQWNLTRLAETLVPLVDDDTDAAIDAVKAVLAAFPDAFADAWAAELRAKLGLIDPAPGDGALTDDLFAVMQTRQVDFTGAFRGLAASLRGDHGAVDSLFGGAAEFTSWAGAWRTRLAGEGRDLDAVAMGMDTVNPIYVPRNHLVAEALTAAEGGDLTPFETLYEVVTDPFVERPGLDRFAEPAADDFNDGFQTFCGT